MPLANGNGEKTEKASNEGADNTERNGETRSKNPIGKCREAQQGSNGTVATTPCEGDNFDQQCNSARYECFRK